jgi:hypothetical protein
MQLRDTSSRLDPVQALYALLRAQGLDASDFEFEEHDSGFVDLLGASGRIVSVRRRSTGDERLYATGPDSAWMGAFMMDIGSGHFGKVPRSA